jgi:hypothetical protein
MNDALGNEFGALLCDSCVNILTVTKGAVYMCMSSSELDTLQKAFREAGGKWSTFVIWAKNTFTLGRSDYQRQYEPILYGWKQGADHYWCGDRDQGDVWFFDKPAKNDLHPTMKPVALVERATSVMRPRSSSCRQTVSSRLARTSLIRPLLSRLLRTLPAALPLSLAVTGKTQRSGRWQAAVRTTSW